MRSLQTWFAALRGFAGAASGAYLASWLWTGLLAFLRDQGLETSLAVLGLFLPCPAAYLGYCCLRGLRQRRFAYAAAWGCAFLALPLTAKPDTAASRLGICLLSALFVFLSRFLGQEAFLRYTDPAWYRDPRRIAAKYGRGRLSGHWHISPPFGPQVPAVFDAKSGTTVLHVQGDTIRVEPNLRRGWAFSARDVEGVIQAPGIGHCVPYNAQGQALAVFCLSRQNGEVLAQYLRNRGVPFRRLSEVPPKGPLVPAPPAEAPKASPLGEVLWEAVSEYAAELEAKESEPEEEVRHTDFSQYISREARDIHLQLRRSKPVGVWIAAGLALGMAVFFVGFPVIVLCGGPYEDMKLWVMVVLSCGLIAGPWVLAVAQGELFPPRLSVEYGHIWLDKGLFPIREIPLSDIGSLRYDRSDECYILCGKQEKPLLKFSTRDPGGSQFLNFLTDHNIRILK